MLDKLTQDAEKNSKLNEEFFEGLCDLFLELGIDGHEFINDFTKHYVQRTEKVVKTKSDVYSATGFSEYTAKKYLEKSQSNDSPRRKQFYYLLISRLKELCTASKDSTIPIHGKHGSYVSVFNEVNTTDKSVTAPSMLKKLIKAGFVEKVDKKRIKFLNSLQKSGLVAKEDIIRLLSDLVNRFSNTLLHNFLAKSNNETLFQMSYFSNAVHPSNFKKLTDLLRKEQRKDFQKYQKIIDSFEEKGLMRILVESLNQEIGLTAFTFNTQLRKNHE